MQLAQNVTIRDARDSERGATRDVTIAAYEEYSAVMGPEHWQGYRDSIVSTLTEDGQAERIVAEMDGAIVGSVLLYVHGISTHARDGSEVGLAGPYARLLAVAPSARGQGIGQMLMEECARRARASGATVLALHTTDLMQVAMRMYERMGFVRTPELDFRPAPEVTIKAYALSLETVAHRRWP
jgi:GNAT superfamily N-acetyltransferase